MRVFFEQIEKFSVKILSPKLCGFRKGHSTQHALLNLLKNWQKTLGNWAWAVFWVLICMVHLTVCSCNVTYFRSRACFEQGVPWHSGNYRVCIHSETRTWQDKNIQSIEQNVFAIFLNDIIFRNIFMSLHQKYFRYDKDNVYYYPKEWSLA